MKVPVSIVTDLDNRPDENAVFNEDDEKTKTKRKNLSLLQLELYKTNVKLTLAKEWTLEWCLNKSTNLSKLFQESVSEVHPQIFKVDKVNFESELIVRLKNKGIDKVRIASTIAEKIENSKDLIIDENDEYIEYLVKAIKHACNEN